MTNLAIDYKDFLQEIKWAIEQAQYRALSAVNKELVKLYRTVGKMISEKNEWWKNVIENLSKDLSFEYPWIKWFSSSNIWRMVNFYDTYKDNEKLATLSGEISRSNNVAILEHCKDDFQREFYIKSCKKFGRSYRVLINMVDGQYYERYMIAHKANNLDTALLPEQVQDTKLALKDTYMFDFLWLGKKHSERELHEGLVWRIKEFLLELWMGFAFVWSEYELKVDWDSYYLDLLFYHITLKCYIVVELKVTEFKPEFLWKLNFYVNVVDDLVKARDDNRTIWLIICKSKKDNLVRYALKDINKPIAVSKYDYRNELWDLADKLPSPEQLEKALKDYLPE